MIHKQAESLPQTSSTDDKLDPEDNTFEPIKAVPI